MDADDAAAIVGDAAADVADAGVAPPTQRREHPGLRTHRRRGSNFMMDNSFIVLAYDVDPEFDDII